MELVLRGQLENVFKAKDFEDKKTGEVSKGKWQLQFMEKVPSDEGQKIVMHKVSIPNERLHDYKDKEGQEVEVPVRATSIKNQVIYYGI